MRTLSTGINLLDNIIAAAKKEGSTQIAGKQAFTLFDTYGFPLDLTELICHENGLSVELEEFNAEMQKQKERARNAAVIETGDWQYLNNGETESCAWDKTECSCRILRYRKVEQKKKVFYEIVLDHTPFYAEMGGQVGDQGLLVNQNETVEIFDVKRENNMPIHLTTKLPENPNAEWTAKVNVEKRHASEANHTATHLLDQALREVLGTHVEQKGSLVTPDSLRFDFSHFQKVTAEEIRQVEKLVNRRIRENIPLQDHRDVPIDEAKKLGALALFGEKYGDKVRVVQFGNSIELCGGCHAKYTGQIGLFRIVSESSVAAGIRRIEAITGSAAEESMYYMQDVLTQISEMMQSKNIQEAIKKTIEENAHLQKQVEEATQERLAKMREEIVKKSVTTPEGIHIVKQVFVQDIPAQFVKDLAFQIANILPENTLCAFGSKFDDKPLITVMISKDLVESRKLHAGNLVREAAKLIQGGGGGAPHFATAGGKDTTGIDAAVEKVLELAGL